MADLAHQQHAARKKVWLLAALSLVVQLVLAAVTESYPYDAGCFAAWAQRMASLGPAAFYAPDYFCDYPPGYMLLLWLPGKLLNTIPYDQEALRRVVLALWPSIATALCGPVVYEVGRRYASPAWALRCAGAVMLCPAMLFNSGVWGQIDGVFSLVMLCCFAFLEQKAWLAGALCYGIALAIKPQALLAGPALAICFLLPIVFGKDTAAKLAGLKNGVFGAGMALAPVAACGLPFWGVRGLVPGLVEKYFTTASSYPYATINACNFMAFLGGEWANQTTPVYWFNIPLMSWQQLGTAMILLVTAGTALWAAKAYKAGQFSPLLTAAVYVTGVFTFAHRMHERYLVFAVVLLGAAAARFAGKKLLSISWGLALTSLLNMALVYGTVGTDDEFLSGATSQLMLRTVGLAETVLCLVLVRTVWQMCTRPAPAPAARKVRKKAAKVLPEPAPHQPWTRREALGLLGLTLATAVLSFSYLGDMTAPQTCVDANGQGSLRYQVATQEPVTSVWVYPGISSYNNGKLTLADEAGNVVVDMALSYSNPFCWQKHYLPEGLTRFTVTVTEGQVFEISLRDASGDKTPAIGVDGPTTSGSMCELFDEAHLVPDTVSQLNSFYFDEIYHARTGYEHLHAMNVYETTHPPLGKVLIALGIAIFGMTGFGWRFMGTLAGVLMVPVMYDFVRRLTRRPWLAGFAACLLALDFMRFSQTRLATIDSYVVLFILLGADLMLWYCRSVKENGVDRSVLPMALCGLAFGLGCASKWTGIYAGAGLAVLYFGVLWQRASALYALPGGKKQLKKEVAFAIGGGVLFFVVVPLCIYIASYLPYRLHDPGYDLAAWWNSQKGMFNYHSGLEATHPFSSSWYSWLLDARPVWYYMGGGLDAGMYASIAGFVSPVVIVAGLAGWLNIARRQLVGDGTPAGGALIVVTLSSLLPWILVTRCTFLYHFFPCVPMLIAAAALSLAHMEQTRPGQARRWAAGILFAAAVLFIWFYPVLAGVPIPRWWAAALKWLPSWGFYIL